MTDEPASGKPISDKPDPEVVTQRLEDELVVVHLRTNRIFVLNRTAARYWELLDSGLDSAQIQETLLREFAVDEDELRGEIESFVSRLASEELIRGDDAS